MKSNGLRVTAHFILRETDPDKARDQIYESINQLSASGDVYSAWINSGLAHIWIDDETGETATYDPETDDSPNPA